MLPIGDLRPVKREISGTYVCRAKSSRGEVIREVVVNVICECAGVLGRAGQGGAVSPAQPSSLPIALTDHDNNMIIIVLVTAAFIMSVVLTGTYLYNRQRKIREYKLQKAQEAAAMKLNTPP